jgi:hypothetical protein
MTTSALSGARISGTHLGTIVLSVVLLAAWLGAALFFSAIVARAAFSVLPTRTLAGALVGRTLPALFLAGLVIGAVVMLLGLRDAPTAPWRATRVVTALGTALLCALAQFGIGGRIERLRAELGVDLAMLAAGDPARIAFGRLHALSVLALALAMVLAAIALFASWRSIALLVPPHD